MSAPLRLNLWSGPRNVSTALMYAFAQRADTRALDEPLYGHYLARSGAPHPGAAEVMAAMDCDGARVVRRVLLGPCDRSVLFCKHMAHHLLDLDRGFLEQGVNVLLTRHPREVLPSLAKNLESPTLRDAGYAVQVELLEAELARGVAPIVLDARLTLEDPEGVLRALCARVGLAFDPAMLRWAPGPKPFDGVWAPHWYANAHRSTGFKPYRAPIKAVPGALAAVYEACLPYYERLVAYAIGAEAGEKRQEAGDRRREAGNGGRPNGRKAHGDAISDFI